MINFSYLLLLCITLIHIYSLKKEKILYVYFHFIGKAAAFLGTIAESAKYQQQSQPQTQHSSKIDVLSKNKRAKNNMSDDISSTTHYILSKSSQTKLDPTLSRRNSDPANKIPLLEVNRGNDLYQSSTNINIGGHRFRKVTRINKSEKCASCDESDSFISEGHRCLDCKILVHTKCIQNGGIKSIKCGATKRSNKRLKKVRVLHQITIFFFIRLLTTFFFYLGK